MNEEDKIIKDEQEMTQLIKKVKSKDAYHLMTREAKKQFIDNLLNLENNNKVQSIKNKLRAIYDNKYDGEEPKHIKEQIAPRDK